MSDHTLDLLWEIAKVSGAIITVSGLFAILWRLAMFMAKLPDLMDSIHEVRRQVEYDPDVTSDTLSNRTTRIASTLVQFSSDTIRTVSILSPLPVVVVHMKSGMIFVANRHAEALFGWEGGTLTNRHIDVLIPAEYRDIHSTHRSRYEEAPSSRPMAAGKALMARHIDGHLIPVDIGLSPFGGEYVLAYIHERPAAQRVIPMQLGPTPSEIKMQD